MSSSWIIFIASASLTVVTALPAFAQNATSLDPAARQFSLKSAPAATKSSSFRPKKTTRKTTANRPTNTSQLIASQINQAINRPGLAYRQNSVSRQLVSPGQQQALTELSRQAIGSGGVAAYFDSSVGTPTFIKLETRPPALAMRGQGKELAYAIAKSFLQDNRALLKLENPDAELLLKRSNTDTFGMQHLTFQQQINDVPVWASQLQVHLKGDNSVYLMNGRFQPSMKLNTIASLTSAQAEDVVLTTLNTTSANKMNTELMVYTDDDGQAILTYRVDVELALDKRWDYFIDAHNGEVVHVINKILDAGTVTASQSQDALGVGRSFNSWSEDGTFYMIDPTFPLNDPAHDPLKVLKPKGDTYIFDNRNGDSKFFNITSSSATTGWDPVAVSAMVNTRIVYDYFKNTHSRDGIDGENKNFQVVIHHKTKLNNAFWNGTQMVFGDGDGIVFSSLAKCLDVTGHEMSHGVVETTAGLKYENQSGALNESFADIFGAMVDKDDWTMGEDCTVSTPGYLRNLQNPALGLNAQPTKMSEFVTSANTEDGDWGGVHGNSGIPNRAAYLIAEGLTAEGLGTSIGKDKMEKIFYRTLTTYLTASSNFIDARRGSIKAAEDIHGTGSAEAIAVAAGWDAVEVVDNQAQPAPTPADTSPTPTDAVTGDDQMFYLYPVDDTRDDADGELYVLFKQTMNESNGVLTYQDSLDVQISDTQTTHSGSRPAVITGAGGTLVLFVGSDNNVYSLNPANGAEEKLTSSDDIWSVTISPDGSFAAYTSTDPDDNNIHVINIATDAVSDYPITPPNYSQDNTQVLNSVKYADSISFDYTSKKIVFDALNCLSSETSSCDDDVDLDGEPDGGYRYWSIGIMDATNGSVSYPFPSQSPDIDMGYPMFAQNNNYVVSLDYADFSSGTTVDSRVVTINLENQKMETVFDFGTNPDVIYGTPSFWGKDDFITIQAPTGTSVGTIAKRIPVNTEWQGNQTASQDVNAFAVAMPIMHKAGQRVLTGSLVADSNNLNFGDLNLGAQADQTITLSNNGNSDVNITNITLAGTGFTQNGTNVIVPRQTSVTITVSFKAGTTVGAKTGTLTFSSDSGAQDISISLIANSIDSSVVATSDSSGGGSPDLPLLSVLITVFLLRRKIVKA